MPEATRTEIAEAVGGVFSGGPVSRAELIDTATAAGARPQVATTLERLPDRRFEELRDLWGLLPGVPIEHDHAG